MLNVHNDPVTQTFQALITAYREASQPDDRQMYERAIRRRLVHESRQLAGHITMLAEAMETAHAKVLS